MFNYGKLKELKWQLDRSKEWIDRLNEELIVYKCKDEIYRNIKNIKALIKRCRPDCHKEVFKKVLAGYGNKYLLPTRTFKGKIVRKEIDLIWISRYKKLKSLTKSVK